jgi:hypothetical protein
LFILIFYTIFNVLPSPVSFHIAPDGSPAEDVGMFLIDNWFTNVAQAISAVMFEPTINEHAWLFVLLDIPPAINE